MSSTRRPTLRVKREQTDNGGEEERDSKRPRTSKPISSKVIIGSDTTMVNDVAAPSSSSIAPQSKAVATSAASAIKNKITSKKNGDTSGNGNGDISNDNNNIPTSLPTKEELKKELYKLVDTDHFSRDESLQALHRIDQWNVIYINDIYNDDSYFRDYFYNYGGLQIVLDFVENFSNDAECVESTKLFLQGDMLCDHLESRDIIFNHGVIEFLLQSISKIVEGNLDGPKLKALENIWDLIDTIFRIIGYGRRKIDVSSNSFKNRFYSIVNSCLDLLTKLQRHDIRTSFDIMSKTFSILVHVTRISKTMKDYAVKEKLRNKGIIPKMLELFKKVDVRDEKLLRSALRMLEDLNDKNLLTQASDFQSLLPLLVAAIRKFPPGIWLGSSKIITVLEKATDTIENKLIFEKAGVLGSLVSLLEKNSTTDDDDDENLTSLSSSYPSASSSSSSESTDGETAAERSSRRRQKKTRRKEKWDKHTRRERKRENDRMKDIVRNLVAKICTR